MTIVVAISLLAGAVGAVPDGTRYRLIKVSIAWLASSALVGAAVLAFGPRYLALFLVIAGAGLFGARVALGGSPGEPGVA